MRYAIAVLLCLVFLTGIVYGAESGISALDAACTVAEDGSCTTVIKAQANLPEGATEFTLAIPSGAKDISVAGFSFEKKKGDGCLLVTVYNAGGFAAGQTFTVSYRLAETAAEGVSGQDFALPLLCPSDYGIESYHATVTLPKSFEEMPVFTSAYYPGVIDNYMDIKITENVIDIQMLIPVLDHETVTMSMTLPQDYFDLRFLSGRTAAFDTVAFWVLLAACLVYWALMLREPLRKLQKQAMPPVGSNPGVIHCQLAGKPADLGLMSVYWASIGYITLRWTRKGRLSLYRRIDMGNERKPYETAAFAALFRRSDRCDAGSGPYWKAQKKAAAAAKDYWGRRLFRRRGKPQVLQILGLLAGLFLGLMVFDRLIAPESYRWWLIVPMTLAGCAACYLLQGSWALLFSRHPVKPLLLRVLALLYLIVAGQLAGRLLLTLVNLLLQALVGAVVFTGGRRSNVGKNVLYELLGLRRYLRTATAAELQIYLEQDSQYFYHTLPYAEALGIGRRFAAKFGNCRLEPCDWLDWAGRPAKTPQEFYQFFRQTVDRLQGQDRPGLAERFLQRLRRRRYAKGTGPAERVPVSATHVRPHRIEEYDFDQED